MLFKLNPTAAGPTRACRGARATFSVRRRELYNTNQPIRIMNWDPFLSVKFCNAFKFPYIIVYKTFKK